MTAQECPIDLPPEPLVIDADNIDNNVLYVHQLGETDSEFAAPIDIDVVAATAIDLPLLEWHNYEVMPRKMRLTNTGKTLVLSGKWPAGRRPYLSGGPLRADYVISQLHFHWGASGVAGSEHTVDAHALPLELHAMHFNRSYSSHEAAARQPDGILCVCYLFQIQSEHSDAMQPIVSVLRSIRLADTQLAIRPFVLTRLLYPFRYDYYLYWGRCGRTPTMWLLGRNMDGISFEQLCLLRQLLDASLRPIVGNWRPVNARHGRQLLHVCAAVARTNATMSPVPLRMKACGAGLGAFVDAMEEAECVQRLAKWTRKDSGPTEENAIGGES